MRAPAVFGESALSSEEALRTRAASVFAVGVKKPEVDEDDDGEAEADEEAAAAVGGGNSGGGTGSGDGGDGGCKILSFAVNSVEALIGFSLTKHSTGAYNRKLLASIKVGEAPLLSGLSDEAVTWLMDALAEQTLETGAVVVAEGVQQEALYILKRGSVTIGTGSKVVSQLGVGDVFGEMR